MLIKEKINQAIEILNEFSIDCWITFVRETSIFSDPILPFLVKSDLTWHSSIIITSSGKKFAVVGKYDKAGLDDLQVYDEVIGYVQGIKTPFNDILTKLNPKQIAINYSSDSEIADGITYGMYLTLHNYLSEIGMQDKIISSEKIISALRQRKTQTELKNIKSAVDKAENIFAEAAKFIKAGKTEAEIAEFMRKKVKEQNLELAWNPESCPSVFTGPDTAEAHYNPTERIVEEGHVLNIDFGVKVNNYCSDLQRTFYIMKNDETDAPPDVKKGFEVINHSIEESRKAIIPGVKGVEIDTIARNIITSNGYPEFPHGLGHQVGRFAHDGTALLGPAWEKYAIKPFVPIEENMVFTIEPRLPVKDKGIVTVEEMVVVKKNGAEYLSNQQKELILVRN